MKVRPPRRVDQSPQRRSGGSGAGALPWRSKPCFPRQPQSADEPDEVQQAIAIFETSRPSVLDRSADGAHISDVRVRRKWSKKFREVAGRTWPPIRSIAARLRLIRPAAIRP